MITLSPTFKTKRKQLCLDVLEMIIVCALKISLYYLLSIKYMCRCKQTKLVLEKFVLFVNYPIKPEETAKLA